MSNKQFTWINEGIGVLNLCAVILFISAHLAKSIINSGHCHACEDYRPTMIHPSSRAYGGGKITAIDYPDEDSSSSDSDY